MRKDKKSIIIAGLIVLVAIALGSSIYQNIKLKEYKKCLSDEIRDDIQRFARKASNSYDNPVLYAELYGVINKAQYSLVLLGEEKGYSIEEYTDSLSELLLRLKILMLNDKGKVERVFKNGDGSKLLFKISDNFNDKESIKKVMNLLK